MIIKIAGLLVVLALVGLAAWRWLEDRRRTPEIAPEFLRPPSPYPPSRGFKMLDGDLAPDEPSTPEAPRIEHSGELIFGEIPPAPLPSLSSKERHDEQWALERSRRRVPQLRSRRKRQSKRTMAAGVVAVLVIVVLALHLY